MTTFRPAPAHVPAYRSPTRGLRDYWAPILVAAFGVAVLLLLAGAYGLHRDELYFIVAGRHLDWGYADQPPLTPLLNAASAAIFGVSTAAIRILPAFAYGACVLLAAAIARELGGTRRAAALAALVLAISGYVDAGHMNTTATYDVLGWTVVLLFTIRALRGADERAWLLAGLAAGIALENKNLVLFLGAGLAVGVVLARRWDLLRSPWLWLGLGVAILIWLPNLVWQASHGWPQLDMARIIAARSGDENRTMLIPSQLLFAGPFLFPVAFAGLWWFLRSPDSRPWRPIGWAYLVVLVLLFATSGKGYYSGGLLPTLMAAGAVVTDRWLARGHVRLRGGLFAGAAVASAALVAVLVLPIAPVSSLMSTPIPNINSDVGNQIGWAQVISTVRAVSDGLPAADRERAVILAGNYGEAGSLQLLAAPGLPPVYSGHNSYADWGPPPEALTLTILVDSWDGAGAYYEPWLGHCDMVARIDVGMTHATNEEQDAPVWVCRQRAVPWTDAWPNLSHLG